MRNILAACLAAALCAASAQESAQPEQAAVPFKRLSAGEAARCMSANGCVAMDVKAFRQILRSAIQRGAQACAHST